MVEGWPGVVIATVFVLTTGLCALSLAAHGTRRSTRLALAEANHVAMGVAMVLMAASATADLIVPGVGVIVFGVAAAGWLGVLLTSRLLDDPLGSIVGCDRCTGHPVHLVALDAAMVVMYVAMVPTTSTAHEMPGMSGMEGMQHAPPSGITAVQVVAAVLALYLVGHAVATAVVLTRRSRTAPPTLQSEPQPEPSAEGGVVTLARPVRVLAHGRVQLIGQAGMGLAMAAMLLLGV
ncbi:DUF5134 domain-containing protein [Actinomycetospora termitidis]|uniref:DUF5134 domain-containing protein n=1 Tax=Actinomycetospora termitidis TaxID=3053470 RepID=A0ABT7M597_9PSEU|nr:DUF5134 domain-containing protein [Actinomycetospora sp. Odt1-22]MDL5155860.1 DUF5134 domain-containing protein [Actinomycetospora sp. Odt1-22]